MRKTLFLAALLAATPFAAQAADGLSYTFVEGGYTHAEMDLGDGFGNPKADGGYLRGSYALTDATYVFGGYSRVSDSVSEAGLKVEADLDQYELGLGWHMPMTDRIDFTAEAAYVRLDLKAKASFEGVSASDSDAMNAGRVTLGLRGTPSARTEAWAKAGAMDGSDMDSEFVGNLGGQFKFNPTWGLVGDINWIGDVTQYSVGVRASF
ncbi:MAG: outer membrane beta-barrel protein [Stenotrophomonas sp.]